MSEGQRTDAAEMKEMINIFSEKIPALLNSLTDILYGKAAAEKYGQAIANFYKTLKDTGMTDEQAFRLTEQYMSSLNLGKMIAQAVGSERGRHRGGDEDRREIRVKVKGKADEDDV